MTSNTISLFEAAKLVYDTTKLANHLYGNRSNYQELVHFHVYHLIDAATNGNLSIYGKNNKSLQMENIESQILKKLTLKDHASFVNSNGITCYTDLYCNLNEVKQFIEQIMHSSFVTPVNSDLIKEWINKIQSEIEPQISGNQYFINSKKILDRFKKSVIDWQTDSTKIHPLIENANELCAALAILNFMKPNETLQYEPKLKNTKKTIDFLLKSSVGLLKWIDVKTVAPRFNDSQSNWERVTEKTKDSPPHSQLVLDQKFCGAAIGGALLNCRWSFVQRTQELEEKTKLLADAEKGTVKLLLCSDGLWKKSDLEDFVDFYRNNTTREDDPWQNAIKKHMADENILFSRSINGFCYLERRQDEVYHRAFEMDVQGPIVP